MNHRTRKIVETIACERRYGIADAKGSEYSGAGSTYKETGADTLANFKKVSERIGGTPEQVLMTYLLKHMDSITTTVREAADEFYSPTGQALIYAKGEGIVSRLDDARNYLDLLECLLIDNGYIDNPSGYDNAARHMQIRKEFIQQVASQTISEDAEAHAILDAEQDEDLKRAGLVQGLDGVWRGATTIDESVKNPGEKQTPIYAQPTMDTVRYEKPYDPAEHYGETGELA